MQDSNYRKWIREITAETQRTQSDAEEEKEGNIKPYLSLRSPRLCGEKFGSAQNSVGDKSRPYGEIVLRMVGAVSRPR